MIELFRDAEEDYLRWVREHPEGYVLNTYRTPSTSYLVLHSAACGTIATPKRTNYTTRDYIKACSTNRSELEGWAARTVSGVPRACGVCSPAASDLRARTVRFSLV